MKCRFFPLYMYNYTFVKADSEHLLPLARVQQSK